MLYVVYAIFAKRNFSLDSVLTYIVILCTRASSKIPTLKLYYIDLKWQRNKKRVFFVASVVLCTVLCHTICIQLVQLNERILKMNMVTVDKVTKNAHTNLLTGHLPNWLFSQRKKVRKREKARSTFFSSNNNNNNNDNKKEKQQQ